MTAFQITMRELDEAANALSETVAFYAGFIVDSGHDFTCPTWARWAREHADALGEQQQAEIRAETNIPQWMVW